MLLIPYYFDIWRNLHSSVAILAHNGKCYLLKKKVFILMGDTQALPSWYEICLKCPGVTGRRPNSKCLVCIPVSHILEAFWQIAVTSLALHTLPSKTLVAGNIILCCLPMLSPWSNLGLGSSVSTVYPASNLRALSLTTLPSLHLARGGGAVCQASAVRNPRSSTVPQKSLAIFHQKLWEWGRTHCKALAEPAYLPSK